MSSGKEEVEDAEDAEDPTVAIHRIDEEMLALGKEPLTIVSVESRASLGVNRGLLNLLSEGTGIGDRYTAVELSQLPLGTRPQQAGVRDCTAPPENLMIARRPDDEKEENTLEYMLTISEMRLAYLEWCVQAVRSLALKDGTHYRAFGRYGHPTASCVSGSGPPVIMSKEIKPKLSEVREHANPEAAMYYDSLTALFSESAAYNCAIRGYNLALPKEYSCIFMDEEAVLCVFQNWVKCLKHACLPRSIPKRLSTIVYGPLGNTCAFYTRSNTELNGRYLKGIPRGHTDSYDIKCNNPAVNFVETTGEAGEEPQKKPACEFHLDSRGDMHTSLGPWQSEKIRAVHRRTTVAQRKVIERRAEEFKVECVRKRKLCTIKRRHAILQYVSQALGEAQESIRPVERPEGKSPYLQLPLHLKKLLIARSEEFCFDLEYVHSSQPKQFLPPLPYWHGGVSFKS